jgi:uncharacterized phage infection (PIP) family protein YhgE
MPTIEDLRKQIAKEKAYIDYERNESKDYEEKVKLQKQLKELQFNRKYGKTLSKVKPIVTAFKDLGKTAYSKAENLRKIQDENERRDKAIRKKGFVQPRGGIFG